MCFVFMYLYNIWKKEQQSKKTRASFFVPTPDRSVVRKMKMMIYLHLFYFVLIFAPHIWKHRHDEYCVKFLYFNIFFSLDQKFKQYIYIYKPTKAQKVYLFAVIGKYIYIYINKFEKMRARVWMWSVNLFIFVGRVLVFFV